MVVKVWAELLERSRSDSLAETEAVLKAVSPSVGAIPTVTLALEPAAIVPRLQASTPLGERV